MPTGRACGLCTSMRRSTLLLRRNQARPDPVPEKVIARMLEKFELPDPTEAHHVDYVWNA